MGTNIRNARDAAGLAQRQLGDLIGVDGSDISRYERGIVRPGDDRLAQIAEVLGHDVPWFYANHDPDHAPEAAA